MKNWDLRTADATPSHPRILSSSGDARVVVVDLPAGERLAEHEVHERAFVLIVDGEVEMLPESGERVAAVPGHLFEFEQQERHEVEAVTDARLLILLTPWPGPGHPGAMTLADKETVRERAAANPPRPD